MASEGAYMEGRRAYDNGEPNKANPYQSGHGSAGSMSQSRVDWFNGWYDEWRWQKWGANHGEQYVPLHKVGA